MDIAKIGHFLAECRKEKGLTQEQLAEKLGVSNRSVSRWETGKTLPDYSLYESICRELNITIYEFFAAQHRTPQNQATLAIYSWDQILREYIKMKKQRKILGIVVFVIAVLLVIRLLLPFFVIPGVMTLEFLIPFKARDGAENYDKDFYLEKYGGDLGSDLMIFPDSLDEMKDTNFRSSLKTGLLDTDGYLLLECTLDPAAFQKEVERLSSLEATIRFNDESFTNYVLYDEDMYPLPAYITCDGFDSTYEYALIDAGKYKIVYLYISYPEVTNLTYAKYLKKNLLAYTKSDLDSFSMYYHTFDGGQSYIGYQD